MAGEIQGIIDRLVVIQEAISPPTGQKALVMGTDEMPAVFSTFPIFVNIEREISEIRRGPALRQMHFVIDMHLLFAAGPDAKYSQRARRTWVKAVLDAFDGAIRLGNTQAPVQNAQITAVSFEPVEINVTSYVAATFIIELDTSEAFTFAA